MRKEIIVAIIVGIGVGIAVAFGIWRANSALKEKLPDLPNLLEKKEANLNQQEFDLTIAQPEQNDVITESPVLISGITKPDSWVAISGETEDYILKTDGSGTFSQEVDLSSGVNQVIVASFNEGGEKNEKNLTVVYSTEFAKDLEE